MYYLALMVFFFTNVHATNSVCPQQYCTGVVDAGSTGTRAHIYAYDFDDNHNPINIKEIWSNKINPGIASLDIQSNTINHYLDKLFANSPVTNIPFYFYSTAGMRLHSQKKQDSYYHLITSWFNNHPQWLLNNIKTISGQEEAVYGWLSVNYQIGAFTQKGKPLVGVMDMGGASVQITFPVQNTGNIVNNDLIQVDIYGYRINLFAHSFLGLGQTLLSQQYLDANNCFAKNYQLPASGLANGDAYSCQRDVEKLINTVHNTNRLVAPVLNTNPMQYWYTIGGLAILSEDKSLGFKHNQFTSDELLAKSNKIYCQQEWQYIKSQYPDNEYIHNYCLNASYFYALIVNGYGLSSRQTINTLSNHTNADWTIGVILQQH
ncbi:MAG: multidrug DMT transporter permease [Legionella sp.]